MTTADGILGQLAVACGFAGLIAGALVLARARQLVPAVRTALDFWLAAGLLRLTGEPTWQALAGAAGVVALRRLLNVGLHLGTHRPDSAEMT